MVLKLDELINFKAKFLLLLLSFLVVDYSKKTFSLFASPLETHLSDFRFYLAEVHIAQRIFLTRFGLFMMHSDGHSKQCHYLDKMPLNFRWIFTSWLNLKCSNRLNPILASSHILWLVILDFSALIPILENHDPSVYAS